MIYLYKSPDTYPVKCSDKSEPAFGGFNWVKIVNADFLDQPNTIHQNRHLVKS